MDRNYNQQIKDCMDYCRKGSPDPKCHQNIKELKEVESGCALKNNDCSSNGKVTIFLVIDTSGSMSSNFPKVVTILDKALQANQQQYSGKVGNTSSFLKFKHVVLIPVGADGPSVGFANCPSVGDWGNPCGVHVFKGKQGDDSAVQNAKAHANRLKRTSGADEPYFQALEAGFRDWNAQVQPVFQHTDPFQNDECFVVIYTDEPDEGSFS